jgi:hypothetical protein
MYKYLTIFALLTVSMTNAQVKDWQAGVKMDNMLFPSYILAHAGWDDNEGDTLEVDGQPYYIITEDGTSQIGVELDLDQRAEVKIELLPSEVNTYSVYQGKLAKGTYGVYPKINYKYDFMKGSVKPPALVGGYKREPMRTGSL